METDRIQRLKEELAIAEKEKMLEEAITNLRKPPVPDNFSTETLFNDKPNFDLPPPPRIKEGVKVYDTISKKSAVVEIINRHDKAKTFAILSIAMPFIILIGNLFSNWVGIAMALVAIVPAAIFLFTITKETSRLKYEYGLR